MRKNITLMMGLAVLLTACQSKQQDTLVVKLHENWMVSSTDGKQSYPATVPGNIFSDLMDNEIIEDPFVGENEYKVQWVSDSVWVYKSTFTLPNTVLDKEHITLNFDGLDTIIHLSSVANDPCGDLNPKLTWEISGLATMQLADKAARAGVSQFIYASRG